ncbi:MAG: proline dehydrogenase family protein, partial [Dehalococcoidia bacterium]
MEADIEAQIQSTGRRLLDASEEREPLLLTPNWWQERMLSWATGDEEFRVKLLRFVDVMPALRSAKAVADHVRLYFREDSPAPIEAGSELAAQPLFRPVVSRIVREGVYQMAHRFIAGETPKQAVPRLRDLARQNTAYTVDLLGEATLSEDEAEVYAQRYAELVEVLSAEAPGPSGPIWQQVPKVNLSIKLSALCSQFEVAAPDAVCEVVALRLRPLLRLARERGAFINVDMEQYRFKDLVHHCFASILSEPEFASFSDIGIVVQAYLKDAEADVAKLRALAVKRGAPFSVRLVKGAYWEEERIVASQNDWEVPVYEDKDATDASYERCTDALLAAWPHLRPCFGTHNPRSIAQALVKAQAAGVEKAAIEFQMLYGMAEELREAVAKDGYRTRVYVPVGAVIPGMAYLVRRLLENTSNQAWFMRGGDNAKPEVLLAPPQPGSNPPPSKPLSTFENAPPSRFYEPEVRREMQAAIDRARGGFGKDQPLLVGHHALSKRETAEVRYPADPSLLIGRVAQATVDDVNEAVGIAKAAFPAWRDRPAGERASILRRAADLMLARRYDLAALMVFESAKPWHEADGDVIEAADYLRFYAREAERQLQPIAMDAVLGEDNVYVREGRGVVAVIAPWNFPLAIICGMSSAAL